MKLIFLLLTLHPSFSYSSYKGCLSSFRHLSREIKIELNTAGSRVGNILVNDSADMIVFTVDRDSIFSINLETNKKELILKIEGKMGPRYFNEITDMRFISNKEIAYRVRRIGFGRESQAELRVLNLETKFERVLSKDVSHYVYAQNSRYFIIGKRSVKKIDNSSWEPTYKIGAQEASDFFMGAFDSDESHVFTLVNNRSELARVRFTGQRFSRLFFGSNEENWDELDSYGRSNNKKTHLRMTRIDEERGKTIFYRFPSENNLNDGYVEFTTNFSVDGYLGYSSHSRYRLNKTESHLQLYSGVGGSLVWETPLEETISEAKYFDETNLLLIISSGGTLRLIRELKLLGDPEP